MSGDVANERPRESRLRVGLEGGAVAGLISGAVLALARVVLLIEVAFLVVWLSPSRRSLAARFARSFIWVALKFPAHLFVGRRSLEPGFDGGVVALGLLTHFGAATVWGTLFGLAATGRSRAATIALGLLWGLGGAIAEAMCLSQLVGGGLWAHASITPVFLIYGLVLAHSLKSFERRRGWAAPQAPRSRGS